MSSGLKNQDSGDGRDLASWHSHRCWLDESTRDSLRDELQWVVLEYFVTTIWLIVSWSDPTKEPEFGKMDNYKNERIEKKKRDQILRFKIPKHRGTHERHNEKTGVLLIPVQLLFYLYLKNATAVYWTCRLPCPRQEEYKRSLLLSIFLNWSQTTSFT